MTSILTSTCLQGPNRLSWSQLMAQKCLYPSSNCWYHTGRLFQRYSVQSPARVGSPSRRTGPTQSLSLRRLQLKTTIELYLLMKSSIRSVFWTLLNGLSCYFDPIELESQMHMKNIFLAPMNWNATFQQPAHSEYYSEKSLSIPDFVVKSGRLR